MTKGHDRHAARRDLIGGSGALALRNVMQGLLNIVRTKVVAVMLGPAGAGILSQATQFRYFVSRFVYMGFGPGIAKYTAERHAQDDRKGVATLLNSVTTLFLMSGVLLIVIVSGAAKPISGWIFGDEKLWRYAILVVVAIPMFVQTDVASMFLRGTRHFKVLALNGVYVTAIGAAVVIPMVWLYGLDGAIWSIPLAAALSAIVSYRALQTEILKPTGFKSELLLIEKDLLVKLTRFGIVGSVLAISRSLSDLIVRSSVVSSLGREQNGYLQAAWGTANPTMGLIISALVAYGVPTMAAHHGDKKLVGHTRDDLIRFYLLTSVPLGAVYSITASWWLPVFYSRKFLPAEPLAYWAIFGQLLYGLRIMINLGLVAQERFAPALVLAVSQAVAYVILYYIYVPTFAVLAVPLSFFASDVVIGPASWLYALRREDYTPTARTIVLLLSSLPFGVAWAIVPLYFRPLTAKLILLLGLIVWSAMNVRRKDVEKVRQILGRRRRRNQESEEGDGGAGEPETGEQPRTPDSL
jgi:O-antigen/teichoic acid export membrane protein